MNWLVVVDMQNDFISGVLGTPEARAIVARAADKINTRASQGFSIVYTRDTHTADYLNTNEGRNLPVAHCVKGTVGYEICADIPVLGRVINKSAFGSKELAEAIAQKGAEQVELIGLCTDICVISNALLIKAYLPETLVSVDASCCAGVTPQSHCNALEAMRMCQISITGK